ncbi:hypothetical protein ISF_04857 [Cordyceps fumosorosea ARSEF 2679]|uniref:Uncharacterized protein n=1 Tax=Cordyceps fumosorosea (strain ARSEF 2679) TaxID=1081104 RepID=A0A167VU40_CORFA|nr:hypothetical protein ISF_04857 [Cordyceps fumosorosea ARSEF 2679]OAA62981.1 hypothetical protein ISF_04857 [Cordyceps fumosorosea ARSEF 2679]
MKFSFFTIIAASASLAGPASARCDAPEAERRICYNETGGTPQDIVPRDVLRAADYLRKYGSDPAHAFYTMPLPAADRCAEWDVTTYRSVRVLAKLHGQRAAKVTFDDIADTLDGHRGRGRRKQTEAALWGCGSNGGQMAVQVNASDPRYGAEEFKDGSFTNKGILIKVVRNVEAAEEEKDEFEMEEI